ncbi:hypothetical protein MRX96_043212 [Rhipicephalus microplus]
MILPNEKTLPAMRSSSGMHVIKGVLILSDGVALRPKRLRGGALSANEGATTGNEVEDSIAAETQKGTEGNLYSAEDAEEPSYKPVPEDDEECSDEGAENANGEELMEVEEDIVEQEAEESQEGEGDADECLTCEEKVGNRDGEKAEKSQDLEEAAESWVVREDVEEVEENIGKEGGSERGRRLGGRGR